MHIRDHLFDPNAITQARDGGVSKLRADDPFAQRAHDRAALGAQLGLARAFVEAAGGADQTDSAFLDRPAAVIAHTANVDRLLAETGCGVVGAEVKAEFGARSHHPIGLGDAVKREVVDHHTDVACRAIEGDRREVDRMGGRVEAGDETLRRRLFITGGAIDLPS